MRNPLERFKNTTAKYSAGSSIGDNVNSISPKQVADAYHNKSKGEAYIHPSPWTKESEYEWCETVYVGKIARYIITLAKNRMTSCLKSEDEGTQKLCDTMAAKIHWQTFLVNLSIHWDKYGQAYIHPVFDDSTKKEIKKIKLLHPPTITVYRNSNEDIQKYNQKLDAAHLPKTNAKPGTGDEIIGYIQEVGKQIWNFKPDEIIFIPRYPYGARPNGYSILVQTADIISSKLQIEYDQTVMAGRHGDPKHVFSIPADWFIEANADKLTAFKDDMKNGIRAGMDFYFSKSDDPAQNTDVKLLEATGNPQAVIKTQDHAENQFVAAFGLADSFTESESSNKSVGEVQLAFFERDIMADRIMFAEILEDEILNKWLIANGKVPGSAWMEFADLTPDDRLEKLRILAPLFPYLEQDVVDQVLEDAGYIVNADERPDPLLNVSAPMRRFGSHAEFRRLKGIPKKEAALIHRGRDSIISNVNLYKQTLKEVFADDNK